MIDDTRAWGLLRDSAILRVDGNNVTVALACGGTLEACVAEARVEGVLPLVIRSALSLSRGTTVWCKGGTLEYTGALEIDLSDLHDRWQTWLGSRTLEMHATIRAALRDPDVAVLVERWRKDRTSDLADAIEALERAIPSDIGREMDALLGEVTWKARAKRVVALSSRDPDPRIGRGVTRIFSEPGNPFEKDGEQPSFADFGLLLVERHADAGTAEHLDALASRLRVDGDDIAFDLADRLEQIADRTHARYPRDRRLEKPLAAALAGLHGKISRSL